MKPVRTSETNVVLTLSGGTRDNDLPAYRAMLFDARRGETKTDAQPGFVTTWMPTTAEATNLAAGACVELTIWGQGHPPVAVSVTAATVPDRELIDRGHVDRALGHLYAQLQQLVIAAGQQLVLEALPDDAPRTPADEGPRCVAAIESLDTGIDNYGAEALGIPSPGAFADLWVAAVNATRAAEDGGTGEPPTDTPEETDQADDPGDITRQEFRTRLAVMLGKDTHYLVEATDLPTGRVLTVTSHAHGADIRAQGYTRRSLLTHLRAAIDAAAINAEHRATPDT